MQRNQLGAFLCWRILQVLSHFVKKKKEWKEKKKSSISLTATLISRHTLSLSFILVIVR